MRRVSTDLLIIAVLALVSLLVWAGQQHPPDRYLQRIQSSGVLRVGMDPTYPPFDELKGGKVAGYDANLASAVAKDLGVTVEFHTYALDTLYDALAADKVDMLVSALPFIYERQADVRYSVPYYQAGQVLVVRAGETTITSPANLSSKKVGVELGSAADTEARHESSRIAGMQLSSTYRSAEEALSSLLKGEVDAAITDNLSAQLFLGTHSGSLSIISPPLTDEPYVIAMPIRATALSARVDATIERLRASGELARLMSAP